MDTKVKVLYEDNHIIAVYKPAGVLIQPDTGGGYSLMDDVKKYLKEKHKKDGNVFLGLVHRLDKNVSGIVLFGKTSKGASRLSEQFRSREIRKIYTAVVEGEIKPSSGTLINYLKKDEDKKIALVSDEAKEGYSQSELSYETIKRTAGTTPAGFGILSPSLLNYSLLSILLKTGRFHQIRAQLSHAGYPIAGDTKYGGHKLRDISVALCATEITFKTATTGETVSLRIDYPENWNKLLSINS